MYLYFDGVSLHNSGLLHLSFVSSLFIKVKGKKNKQKDNLILELWRLLEIL